MVDSTAFSGDGLFPRLSQDQIARLMPLGTRRKFDTGEVIFEPGANVGKILIVLDGRIEIVSPSDHGEVRITTEDRGQFTGEVNLLSGRPSLVRIRAIQPTEVLEIDQERLRAIVQTDPELSEI